MNFFKKGLALVWLVFCFNGISRNYKGYSALDWAIVIPIFFAPFLIACRVRKNRRKNETITANVSETKDTPNIGHSTPDNSSAKLDREFLKESLTATAMLRSEEYALRHEKLVNQINLKDTYISKLNPRPLSSIEVTFLKYMHKRNVDKPNIAGYWTHEYSINYQDTVGQFVFQGLLKTQCDKDGHEYYHLTKKGLDATKHVQPPAIKDLELEDTCYDLILNGCFNQAYRAIAQFEANKPNPRGLNVDWDTKAKQGLSADTEKNYQVFLEEDFEISEELTPYKKSLKACTILGNMLGVAPDVTARMFRRISQTTFDKGKITDQFYKLNGMLYPKRAYSTYETLGVRNYQISGTLDISTCEKCAALDRQIFSVQDIKIGENFPPFHDRCRCVTVPYFEGGTKSRAMRDPVTGKSDRTDRDMSYNEWYQEYVVERYGLERATIERKKALNQESDYEAFVYLKPFLADYHVTSFSAFQELKYTQTNIWNDLNEKLEETKKQQAHLEHDIINLVSNNPGIRQTEIFKLYPQELKEIVRHRISELSEASIIYKEKSGNTYALYRTNTEVIK